MSALDPTRAEPEPGADNQPDRHVVNGGRLLALIHAYRATGSAGDAAALLGELEIEISAVAARRKPVPPAIDADDVRQQVIMEMLEAARAMKLTERLGWVRQDLILRAKGEVVRWLNAEAGRPPTESLESVAQEGAPPQPALQGQESPDEADVELIPPRDGTGVDPAVYQADRRAYNAALKRRWRARQRRRVQILELNRRSVGGRSALDRRPPCPISPRQIHVK
jgi:hypothetical protein